MIPLSKVTDDGIPLSKVADGAGGVSDEFRTLVDVLRGLQHPNVARVLESYQDFCYAYVVMEFCSGEELVERAMATTSPSEVAESGRRLTRSKLLVEKPQSGGPAPWKKVDNV